jgi:hypothetical protein
MEFKKEIRFTKAWDRNNPPDGAKAGEDYGIHGVEIYFVLTGDKGAVVFQLMTGWNIDESDTQKGYAIGCYPMATDLGYHSFKRKHDYQTKRENCAFLGDKPCYYDGSSLNAEPVLAMLIKDGTDVVWKELEDYYNQVFE